MMNFFTRLYYMVFVQIEINSNREEIRMNKQITGDFQLESIIIDFNANHIHSYAHLGLPWLGDRLISNHSSQDIGVPINSMTTNRQTVMSFNHIMFKHVTMPETFRVNLVDESGVALEHLEACTVTFNVTNEDPY